MSKHISVRIDDELFDIVEQIAKANRMSKSEVVRTALEGELAKIAEHKNKDLSDGQRQAMLSMLGKIMTHVSVMRNDNARLGGNVNQIARALNSGGVGVSPIELQEYINLKEVVDKRLNEFSRGLDAIWRTLV